jgi:hypothetical protein
MPKKRSSKSAELEERIAKAVIAIKEIKVKSAYAAAKEFDVNRGTLMNRLRGGVSHAKGHESTQLLSSAEEKALIAWCKHVAAGGSPARHQLVREMAWEILTRRVASVNTDGMQLVNMPSLGKDWVKRFILRHPEVKTTISAKIDVARWKDSTPESIHEWFDAFNDTCRKFRYNNKNIYNMDETGFSIGTSQCNRVIIDSTLRTRYKVEPGRQEWVSVLECICADGTSLAPLLIMKAENVNTSWINPNTPDSWQWAASSKGWTSNKHGLEWLRRVFEPGTREKAGGKQRLLICDGHDSHITGNFIAHCSLH